MSRKKISTTVYLEASQDARLKQLHARTRVPVAEFIRQVIESFLVRKGLTESQSEMEEGAG